MIFDIVLVIVLAICFITDITKQKIYNIVVFPSVIFAFLLNTYNNGFLGFLHSSIGLTVGGAILIIPYLLGGMGAGDVKLLSFIGALKGINFVLNTALYMALAGGIIALILLISQKRTWFFFRTLFSWIFSFLCGINYKLEFSNLSLSKRFPYGIAIVIGALICLFSKEAWII